MSHESGIAPRAQHDPGREETAEERADRNWNELLQEIRVMQIGVQIITGFLLTLPFQQRFTQLDGTGLALYLGLVVLACLTTAVMLAPVSLHRLLFRHHHKPLLVSNGDTLIKVMVGGIALMLTGCLTFIVHVVIGPGAGWIAGGVLAVVLVLILLVYPLAVGRYASRAHDAGS
ncbi:hypothetical protein GCM10011512_00150 [Tersicoccus solisilvae]|uniref:Sodium:proton antiporter n=1 Tax=Tersicoccus solisilvae TaxID=1882339 RepID=A0ABQ1NHQ3_9MICC|nr:DUF6328 family protein [Tersicoccus solisilvae]GGC77591.1 hypothetical protein GCM10011512_00150 [Tersicoccus solisilvae]